MTTWVLVGVVAWVLLSVPLALLLGAALEHGERVPHPPRRRDASGTTALRPVRLAEQAGRLAS